MWMQEDHGGLQIMKDIFVGNRAVYVYLANPSTREEERRIVDILNKYSAGLRTYLLENPFPVEGVGEKVFYAESLIYREKEARRTDPCLSPLSPTSLGEIILIVVSG